MSKMITVQLYGHPGNNAVVRMPDRKNPGVVIQADTLGALATDARALAKLAEVEKASELVVEEAAALADRLQEIFEGLAKEVAREGEHLKN